MATGSSSFSVLAVLVPSGSGSGSGVCGTPGACVLTPGVPQWIVLAEQAKRTSTHLHNNHGPTLDRRPALLYSSALLLPRRASPEPTPPRAEPTPPRPEPTPPRTEQGDAYFTVPASGHEGADLQISAVPTYGDPDLYVNAGPAATPRWPSASAADWSGMERGVDLLTLLSEEPLACKQAYPEPEQACTYYVRVGAYGATAADVTATFISAEDSQPTLLQEGVPYRGVVPAQQCRVAKVVVLAAAAGPATCASRRPPACARRPSVWVPEQSCGRVGPAAPPWSLAEGPPRTPASLALLWPARQYLFFDYTLSSLEEEIAITLTPLTGDPDLYAAFVQQRPKEGLSTWQVRRAEPNSRPKRAP